MKFRTFESAVILTVVALSIAGCAEGKNSRKAMSTNMTLSTFETQGATKVSQVEVQPRPDGLVQFSAGGAAGVTDKAIFDVIYCRAQQYRIANGFDAQKPQTIQRVSHGQRNSPQIWTVIMNFYKSPLPADVKPATGDNCAEIPAELM
jgi:hypothetical protein